MGEFLSYSILSGLSLFTLFLVYRFVLAKDNQPAFNRKVLWLIYLLSFVCMPVMFHLMERNVATTQHVISLEGIEVTGEPGLGKAPLWGSFLIWVFITGMVIIALKTLMTWVRLINVIVKGKKIHKRDFTLVITEVEQQSPFSWIRYIVIGEEDYNSGNSAIITHEVKHIMSRHWIDLLLAQMICIINWFNPAAWLMREEMILVHEYEADDAVIESGISRDEYQMLLIKKAVGSRFPSLANSLNHSKIKKRITMMCKEKSGAGHKLKVLTILPVVALTLGLVSVPSVRGAVATVSNSAVAISKDSEKNNQEKAKIKVFKVTEISSDGFQTTVLIKGEGLGDNLTVSGGKFKNKGKTWNASSLRCDMTDGIADIVATFPFSDELNKASMSLIVNGDEVPFDLQKFSLDSRSELIIPDEIRGDVGNNSMEESGSSKLLQGVEIYLNDKRITEAQFKELEEEDILSMTIDKENNAIIINSKK